MSDPDSTKTHARHDSNHGQALRLRRRSLLAYAASAPVATAAAGLLGTSTAAEALPLPLTPPNSVDQYDVGDSLVQLGAPTMPPVQLSIYSAGIYTMALPRLEQGTGIATAVAMMIAEEAGVPLALVRVTSADAQPELQYNQITGGSCSVRAFEPVLPAMVLAARLKAGLPPQAGAPRDPSQYKVLGKRYAKLDARDIVTGKKKFTMDRTCLAQCRRCAACPRPCAAPS